jgi:hypothetical protein
MAVGLSSAALVFAEPVRADPSVQERTMAESLFQEARALMQLREYAQACAKFAESQRLDAGGGTLLNLAICHEHEGRTATAWTELRAALGQARKEGRNDREDFVLEHLARLEPALAKLEVQVSPADQKRGMVVEVDGAELGRASWATPWPVDPGRHRISAKAPGMQTFQTWIVVRASEHSAFRVPPLKPAPTSGDARTKAGERQAGTLRAATRDGSGRRTAAYLAGGAAVALGLTGGYLGVRAIAKRHASNDECPDEQCSDRGVELNDEARVSARLADVAVGAGLVAVGVGVYLWITSSASAEPARITGFAGFAAMRSASGAAGLKARF